MVHLNVPFYVLRHVTSKGEYVYILLPLASENELMVIHYIGTKISARMRCVADLYFHFFFRHAIITEDACIIFINVWAA